MIWLTLAYKLGLFKQKKQWDLDRKKDGDLCKPSSDYGSLESPKSYGKVSHTQRLRKVLYLKTKDRQAADSQ